MASNVENIFYISEKPWHSLGVNFALSTAKRYREINHIGLNTLIDKAYQLVMAAKYFMGGIICAEKFHCLV